MLPPSNAGPIIMLVRAMSGGGAQRDAVDLANGLRADGWPMLVATLDAAGPLVERLAPGMPLLDLGQGRKRRMALALPAVRGMMARLRPQAVIASEAAANCLLALAALPMKAHHRPRIILREVAAPFAARKSDPFLQNRIGYRLAPWLYPRADRVLSFTQGVRAELIAGFGVAPERAVNLGTNAVLSAARLAELAQPRERDPNHIVAVGRLSPEKDFASLIAASALLRDGLCHLTILGEGPERPPLQALIEQHGLAGRVSLAGFVPEPTEHVRRSALLVSSSRHEGFGNAIVEALACGTPVVATDAPHGPREILDGGRFGTLVPEGDPQALANAMRLALAAPADRAALQARAARYTTEAAVERVAAVFAELGLLRSPHLEFL